MPGQDPIMYDYQTLQTAFQTVKQFGEQVKKLGTTLTSVHNTLEEHCSGDESGVGAVIAGAAKDVTGVAGKVFTEGGRVLAEMGSRGQTNGQRAQLADETVAKAFNDIHDSAFGDRGPATTGTSGSGGSYDGATRTGAGSEPGTEPLGSGDPLKESSPLHCRPGSSDPVDLVTGAVMLPQWDLLLPGTLPVMLERAHISTYRKGRLFGPTWASTLDQRLEIDEDGVHYAAPDGVVLHYPIPLQPGEQVMPAEGARWPLRWDAACDTYVIHKPAEGVSLHFPSQTDPRVSRRMLDMVADANGNTICHHYDENGIPDLVAHSGGYRIAVDTTLTRTGWRVTALRLLDGTGSGSGTLIRRFDYDALGRLADIVDSSGVSQILEYDGQERLTGWIDRNGFGYTYEYGPDGRVVRSRGTDGFYTAEFAYDDAARTTVLTNSLGHRTTYHWNERGQLVAVDDPAGGRSQIERDRFDRIVASIDQLGREVRYRLAPDGRPTEIATSGGRVVTVDYGEAGLPVRLVRPDGSEFHYRYDERGNRIALLGPAGLALTNSYDEHGAVTATTDSLGATVAFECNAAGLPVRSTDPHGAHVTMRYNAFGQPIETTDPLGRVTRLEWTPEGRLLHRTTDAGTDEQWRYDGEGNLVEWTDISGLTTTYEYGPFDTLVAKVEPGGGALRFRLRHRAPPYLDHRAGRSCVDL